MNGSVCMVLYTINNMAFIAVDRLKCVECVHTKLIVAKGKWLKLLSTNTVYCLDGSMV